MRLEAYVFLLFSISIVSYLIGYTSPLLYFWNAQGNGNLDPIEIITTISSEMLTGNALGTLIIGGVIVFGTILLTGYSAMYIVPLVMFLAIANLCVFPISFIFQTQLSDIIKIPVFVMLNILLIMSYLDFIRGKS